MQKKHPWFQQKPNKNVNLQRARARARGRKNETQLNGKEGGCNIVITLKSTSQRTKPIRKINNSNENSVPRRF